MNFLNPIKHAAVVLIITSSFSFASETWKADVPCGKKLPDFIEIKNASCEQSFCSTLPDKKTICACLPSAENATAHITVKNKESLVKEWDMEWMPSYFTSESLRLDEIDLDGDRKNEVVFAMRPWASQGMGIESWHLVVLDGDKISEEITTEDYGTMSYLVCSKKSKGAMLFLSQWQEGWEPSRGNGMYVTARWYQYIKFPDNSSSSFSSMIDRPNIYHRLFNSLENKRNKAMSDKPTPVLWYKNQQTRKVVGPYVLH